MSILKPGVLVKTTNNKYWGSNKFWHINTLQWQDIPTGSPALIISVDYMKIVFLYQDCLFSIHNCYNDEEGMPYWCQVMNE